MQSPSSSVVFSVNGFNIHYYGIIMFFAILTALFVMRFVAKKYYKEVNTEVLLDILPVIIICSILGARLYYVVLDFSYFSKHIFEIFALWNGGMSIHGGILGGVISGIIIAKLKKINFLKYADVFAYGLIAGQAIGRYGNYFNCEAFGKPCSIPYIKLFIPEIYRPFGYEHIQYFHPTFLYESLWDIAVFFILFVVIRKIFPPKNGTIFFSYLILYSIGRFFIEQCRLDSVLNFGQIPVAQIVSGLLIIVGVIGLFFIYKRQMFKKVPAEKTRQNRH